MTAPSIAQPACLAASTAGDGKTEQDARNNTQNEKGRDGGLIETTTKNKIALSTAQPKGSTANSARGEQGRLEARIDARPEEEDKRGSTEGADKE